MVPTATNTFPLYYGNRSNFELPTVLLLDSGTGPSDRPTSGRIGSSRPRRNAGHQPRSAHPAGADPLDLNQLRDEEYGMYTSIASTDGAYDKVQFNATTCNLGDIDRFALDHR